jgi:putative ABC transport system ATP-binding protein
MNQPKILFADEPTGNLDAETAKDIIKLLFDLNERRGTTLLLVTHDRELTRQARRLIRLRGGRLVLDSDEPKPSPLRRNLGR